MSLAVTREASPLEHEPGEDEPGSHGIRESRSMESGEEIRQANHPEGPDQDEKGSAEKENPAENVEEDPHQPSSSESSRRPRSPYSKNFNTARVPTKLMRA